MAEIEPPTSVVILQGSNGQGRKSLSIPLKDYVKVRSQKPNNGLSIFGIVLGVIAPFAIFFIAEDILDVIPFCCLLMLIGFTLFFIGVTKYSKWEKDMKTARERIESEENIPYPPIPQWAGTVATICLVAGFILSDLEGIYFFFGAIGTLIFLTIQVYQHHKRNQAYDALINEIV